MDARSTAAGLHAGHGIRLESLAPGGRNVSRILEWQLAITDQVSLRAGALRH
jgi:hypothetical protein